MFAARVWSVGSTVWGLDNNYPSSSHHTVLQSGVNGIVRAEVEGVISSFPAAPFPPTTLFPIFRSSKISVVFPLTPGYSQRKVFLNFFSFLFYLREEVFRLFSHFQIWVDRKSMFWDFQKVFSSTRRAWVRLRKVKPKIITRILQNQSNWKCNFSDIQVIF